MEPTQATPETPEQTPERHCYFDYRYLQYLQQFIAKEDVRFYLCGAFITPIAEEQGGGVMLAATDGHRLIAIHHKEGYSNGSHILKMPNIKVTKKIVDAILGYKSPFLQLTRVEYKGDQLHHCMCVGQSIDEAREPDYRVIISESSQPIEGRYPNIKRVFTPMDKLAVDRFCVNGEQLAALGSLPAFRKGVKVISGNVDSATIFEPQSTVELAGDDRMVALIMPMRCDLKEWDKFTTDWIPELPGLLAK